MANGKFKNGATEYIFDINNRIPFAYEDKEEGAKYNILANGTMTKLSGNNKMSFVLKFSNIDLTQLTGLSQFKGALEPFDYYPDSSDTLTYYNVFITNDIKPQITNHAITNKRYDLTLNLREK